MLSYQFIANWPTKHKTITKRDKCRKGIKESKKEKKERKKEKSKKGKMEKRKNERKKERKKGRGKGYTQTKKWVNEHKEERLFLYLFCYIESVIPL